MKPTRSSVTTNTSSSSSMARKKPNIEEIKIESDSEPELIEEVVRVVVCTRNEDDYDDDCECAECLGLEFVENERSDEEGEIIDSEVEEVEPKPELEPNPADPGPGTSRQQPRRKPTRRQNAAATSQAQLDALIGCLTPRVSAKRITYREPDTEDESDGEEKPNKRRAFKSKSRKVSGSGTPEPRASTSQDTDFQPQTPRRRSRAKSRSSRTQASPSPDPPPTPLTTSKPKKTLPCLHCPQQFNLNADLLRHLQLHAPAKPFQCHECLKSFDRNETLQRHTILIHKPHTKPFKCEHCGQRFLMRNKFAEHKRLHTGENLVECTQCGKIFTTQDKHDRHQLVHTGERPWACETCGKAFQFKDHLKNHKVLHTGEMPFKCPKCPAAFAFKDRLQKHLICMHPDEDAEKFPCPICKHVFYLEQYMKRHLKRVCQGEGRKRQYYGRNLTDREVALAEEEVPEVVQEAVPEVKGSRRISKAKTARRKKTSSQTSDTREGNQEEPGNQVHPHHRTLGSSGRFPQTLSRASPATPRPLNRIHPSRVKRDPDHKFSCRYPYCMEQFKNKYDMKVHYRSLHFGFKPYRCKYPECNHSCKNRSHLVTHIRTKHLKLPLKRTNDPKEMLRVQPYIEIVEEQLLLET